MKTSRIELKALVLFFVISSVMTESPELGTSTIGKLAAANNGFALKLYQEITRAETKNAFISPLSISSVLAMMLHGAKGETRKELRKFLCFEKEGLSDESIQKGFNQLMKDVFTKNMSSGYTLNSAGRILVNKTIDLLPKYKEEVEKFYNASIRSVDFEHEASEIIQDVNSWVDEQTHGKIQNIISEVNPDWGMVLLNAIYFKGLWKTHFKKEDTEKMPFHNYDEDTEPKKVDTMWMLNRLSYSDAGDYKALRLPYETGKTDMLLVLPTERKGLPALVESLTPEKLGKIITDLQELDVEVRLPKFKFEVETDLLDQLVKIGWKSANDWALDLSGMTVTKKKLKVDKVLQKAFIEVNEEGTEAAAVTFVGVQARMAEDSSPPPETFYADKPFLFFIINQKTNIILFMGQVAEL